MTNFTLNIQNGCRSTIFFFFFFNFLIFFFFFTISEILEITEGCFRVRFRTTLSSYVIFLVPPPPLCSHPT